MAKYNLQEKKPKTAAYRTQVRPEVIDEIYEQILRKMIVEKRYKDPAYTAQKLAEEIHTNTRYISAAVSLRFQMSYSELICGYRIREAVSMLTDPRYRNMIMAEVAQTCGFANRQSFYAAFYRVKGVTPKAFQDEFLTKLASSKQSRKNKS